MCDQIGRFLKVLESKFAYKNSPKRLVTFGAISKRINYLRTGISTIWATFRNVWAAF